MNDSELDSEVKGLRVPERGGEFWDAFPQRVLAELRATPATPAVRSAIMPRLAWGFGVALACLVAAFCLEQGRSPRMFCHALLQHEKELRRTVGQFPGHVCAILQDQHGLGNLVEDQR